MEIKTILGITAFVVNFIAIVLLMNGVSDFWVVGIAIMVSLINYLDGLTRGRKP